MFAVYFSRSQGLNAGATRVSCVNLVPTTTTTTTACVENEAGINQSHQFTYARFLSANAGRASLKFAASRRELSSQAGASSTKEDDDELESGLSGLDLHDESDADLSDGHDDGGKPHDDLGLSDAEIDPAKRKSRGRQIHSELFNAILNAPGLSVDSALDKWVEQGKELSRKEIILVVRNLRRRKMFGRALQVN